LHPSVSNFVARDLLKYVNFIAMIYAISDLMSILAYFRRYHHPCFDAKCSVLHLETDFDALGLHVVCYSGFVPLLPKLYFFLFVSDVMALIPGIPPY